MTNLKTLRGAAGAGLLLWLAGTAQAQIFTNLHSLAFTNGTTPHAALLAAGGTLYGTAENYGGGGNCGSVFKLAADGSSFTNMHTFTQGADGGNPYGTLALAGGTLYGTTLFGGSNFGCIFAINTNGTGLTTLYDFPSLGSAFPYTNSNGAYPGSTLVSSGTTLYGTASSGGQYGWGVAFALNTNGSSFTNLHSFTVADGQYPQNLILAGNTLYGVGNGGTAGVGTIFKFNTDGSAFTNIYNFTAPDYPSHTNADGAFPLGSLVLSQGILYGIANGGGYGGNGTIFAVDTNGNGFTVLHQFSATNALIGVNSDGVGPQSGLILWSNTLYGTAEYGGAFGYGTVFSLETDGSQFTTLYDFSPTNSVTGTNVDGAYPIGGLARSGSVLYGTASAGGASGYGTVFSLLTRPPLNIAPAGASVILSWPADVTGFNLQSATNLSAPSWTAVAGQHAVTNPVAGKSQFFRLMHP